MAGVRVRLLVGAAAVLTFVGLLTPVSAEAAVTKLALSPGRTLSGVVGAGGQSAIDAFGAFRGRPVEVITSYTSTSSWSTVTGVTRQGLTSAWNNSSAHRVWSMPLIPSDGSSTMEQAAAGAYNDKYTSVAQQLIAGGDGSSTIRLGWEMNGDWFAWSGMRDPAAFAGAWRQAVTAMRAVPGANFTFDWSIALGYSNPVGMYPGDGYVDIIGADVYDSSWATDYPPSDHVHVWSRTLTENWGLNWLSSFAASHGKRMSIPEWGVEWLCNGHGGGDDPYFIQQFYNWFATHDVAYEAYFNADVDSCTASNLNDGRFPQAAAAYKALASHATVPSGSVPTGSTPPPTTAAPASTALDLSRILVSTSPARTNGHMLFGATVTGSAYIWLADAAGTQQVRFFIDQPSTSTPMQTENSAPWDLKGGTTDSANPLLPGTLAVGAHQLTVLVTTASGVVQSATVTFRIN
jgi:hypothetical protein